MVSRGLWLAAAFVWLLGWPGVAAATCPAQGGLTYTLRDGNPLSDLVIKMLTPRTPGASTFVGAGTATLPDGTLVALRVTGRGRERKGRRETTYTFSGRSASTRVAGNLTSEGCPAALARTRITVSRRKTKPLRLSDPAQLVPIGTLQPGTLMLDETDAGDLAVDSSAPDVLVFPSTNPLVPAIVPGTVLVIGITSATPGGFLGKVVSVEHGAAVSVVTEPAVLADAFQTLDLRIDSATVAATQARAQAARATPLVDACPRGVCLNEAIDGELEDDHGGKLTFAGSIFADIGYSVALDIDFGHRDANGHAKVFGDVGGDFDLTASQTLDFGGKKEKKLGRDIRLPPITVAGIVITPKIKFYGGASGSITGRLATGVHGRASADAGVVCAHIADCRFEVNHGLAFDSYLDIEATADAKAWVRPRIDLAIYDRVALFTSLAPFVKFNASTSADPWWVLQAGVDANIGIDFDVLLGTITPLNETFTVFEFEAARAPGPFGCTGSCPPPVITTTVLPDATLLEPYSVTLQGSGEPPLRWSLGEDELPPAGLSLAEDGVFAGIPESAAEFPLTIVLTDRFGRTATQSVSLLVDEAASNTTSTTLSTSTTTTLPQDPCVVDLGAGYALGITDAGRVLTVNHWVNFAGSFIVHDLASGTAIDITSQLYQLSGAYRVGLAFMNNIEQILGITYSSPSSSVAHPFVFDTTGFHEFPQINIGNFASPGFYQLQDFNNTGTLLAYTCADGPCYNASIVLANSATVSYHTLPPGFLPAGLSDSGEVLICPRETGAIRCSVMSPDGMVTRTLDVTTSGYPDSVRMGHGGHVLKSARTQGGNVTPMIVHSNGSSSTLTPMEGDQCWVADIADNGALVGICESCVSSGSMAVGLVPYVYPPGATSPIAADFASHLAPSWAAYPPDLTVVNLGPQINASGQMIFTGGGYQGPPRTFVLDGQCAATTPPIITPPRTTFGCGIFLPEH